MIATLEAPVATPPALESAIDSALARIAPLWPLGHFVAVNPFAGLSQLPFAKACEVLQGATGAAPLQSPAQYLAALHDGTIHPDDLRAVADAEWSFERLVSSLENAEDDCEFGVISTVADMLDQQRPHAHWSGFVVEEISKWCGVAFDENQTTWKSPWRTLGLFAAWREAAAYDRNPEVFGLTGFRKFVAGLPDSPDACIGYCMTMLAPKQIDTADFLHRQLFTISGWAGYVKYLVREDELRGAKNPALRELLAIRLAYDAALFHAFARDGIIRADWRHQSTPARKPEMIEALSRWQSAYEAGFQRELAGNLTAQPSTQLETRPVAQAVFCIDVRSEIVRRHLEAALPGLQTIGFAGFFGFPVAHKPAGAPYSVARCPVLLVPPVDSSEPGDGTARRKLLRKGAWKAFQNSAASCFSFVEAAGLGFSAVLGRFGRQQGGCCHAPAPRLLDTPVETRAAMAEGALRNMSLTKNFARLVLICGHGSHSANNPYASALDCGACGGHAGDVNARLAAAALNDIKVRKVLAAKDIVIPDDTVFIAGLHDTLCDDLALFDLTEVPTTHTAEVSALQKALTQAGAATRTERAASLGIDAQETNEIETAVRARGHDISQVRPEWGLANNAALVAAPRSRSSALKLDGRVFLHDYDAAADPDLNVLTLILCAPVVVASWINLQYYASRIDPERYGAGDKALHHVVGGIGVMEGNGGDLKTGLPLQSIHDGKRFVHEPRRLTVFIDATREALETALTRAEGTRQLFDHGWIHLVALEGGDAYRHTLDGWKKI